MDIHKVRAKHNLRFCIELMIPSFIGSIVFFILESVFSNFASFVFKVLASILLGISFLAFCVLLLLIGELCIRKHSIAINKKKEIFANMIQRDFSTSATVNSYGFDSIPLMNSDSSQPVKTSGSNSYQNSSVSETSFQKSFSTSWVYTHSLGTSKTAQPQLHHKRLVQIFKEAAASTFANKKNSTEVHDSKVKASGPEIIPLANMAWTKPPQLLSNKFEPSVHKAEVPSEGDFQLSNVIPVLDEGNNKQKIVQVESCTCPNATETISLASPPYCKFPEHAADTRSRPNSYVKLPRNSKVFRSESCPYSPKFISKYKVQRTESFPASLIVSSGFMIPDSESYSYLPRKYEIC